MNDAALDQVDCVVIGAGIVGLAVARALALRGREVMVLEAESAMGTGISSRNSEVIHAGIYYETGSLKAQLCVEGRERLYDYCAQRHVPHRRCGKLILATSPAQREQLAAIGQKARANGVLDLQWLERDEARALEPALECVAALLSPSTGIVDSHDLMLALQADLEHAGGLVVLNCPIVRASQEHDAILLEAQDGARLLARSVVNAAGLGAIDLARRVEGLAPGSVPTAYYAKGSYFTLAGRAPFSHLVYPVPEAAGLGVHLTLDLGGQAKFGPDVEWVASSDALTVDPARAESFYAEVRRYWPALPDGALQPGYAGIRPKIAPRGAASPDFLIQGAEAHGMAGWVNLYGIESPGLTSALAIGEKVAQNIVND